MTSASPHLRTRRLALAAGLVIVVLAGCAKDDDTAADTSCASTVRSASYTAEVAEQVSLLDDALARCRSVSEFTAEMGQYPGIIGYDVPTFIALRCPRISDETIRTAPVCATVIAPATTVSTNPVELVFVGDTLDGRRIQIRPDADTEFVGEVPAVVQQTVDIAIETGCPGVLAQRDQWAARIGDPTIGDEASVYARHAQNVADYIGCISVPLTVPGAPVSTVPAG